jgi:hypothetical protein
LAVTNYVVTAGFSRTLGQNRRLSLSLRAASLQHRHHPGRNSDWCGALGAVLLPVWLLFRISTAPLSCSTRASTTQEGQWLTHMVYTSLWYCKRVSWTLLDHCAAKLWLCCAVKWLGGHSTQPLPSIVVYASQCLSSPPDRCLLLPWRIGAHLFTRCLMRPVSEVSGRLHSVSVQAHGPAHAAEPYLRTLEVGRMRGMGCCTEMSRTGTAQAGRCVLAASQPLAILP